MSKGKGFKSTDANRLKDEATRDLLFKVTQYLETLPLLTFGFQFVEKSFDAAGTHEIPHSLGFVPKDIILTSKTGAGSATFLYDSFTKTSLFVSVTGPCAIRALYGTYRSE